MKTYDKKTSVFVNLSRLYEDSESMMFYDILDHIVEICDDKQLDSILNTIQENYNKWEDFKMKLTENEYNLIVYCLEQQMYEFNDDEQNDANNIVIKLSNVVEVN